MEVVVGAELDSPVLSSSVRSTEEEEEEDVTAVICCGVDVVEDFLTSVWTFFEAGSVSAVMLFESERPSWLARPRGSSLVISGVDVTPSDASSFVPSTTVLLPLDPSPDDCACSSPEFGPVVSFMSSLLMECFDFGVGEPPPAVIIVKTWAFNSVSAAGEPSKKEDISLLTGDLSASAGGEPAKKEDISLLTGDLATLRPSMW